MVFFIIVYYLVIIGLCVFLSIGIDFIGLCFFVFFLFFEVLVFLLIFCLVIIEFDCGFIVMSVVFSFVMIILFINN